MMLRFVRSQTKLAQLRRAAVAAGAAAAAEVITANIQPVHMAIMEGEQEILLHRTAGAGGGL
jgi:23S rRNA (uracil747-C5)-methyltransferase